MKAREVMRGGVVTLNRVVRKTCHGKGGILVRV